MTAKITISKRFHGPSDSGNGGYSCGLVSRYIKGPAAVRLRIPPPLDTPLELRRNNDGVELYHAGQLVASGRPATVELDAPQPPSFPEARVASERYRGFESHFYPGCFVCGPDREHGDGLRVFAGPVDMAGAPEGMVAAAWVPDASLLDSTGHVSTEYLWAVLDCPGAYSFPEPEQGAILLGELAVSVEGAVAAGEECVLIGWQIEQQGRKHFTGTALFGASGNRVAVGYATWFEVP
ncbi:MAG: hypothetical protein KJO80_15690 [Gammaproteobacteria bacterium]|nr:hypothetical protein [Gammaproteobacteria bacterium]